MNRLSANPTVDRRTLLRTAAAISQALRRSPGLRAPLTVPDGALSAGQAPAIAPGREPSTVTGGSTARVAFVKSDDRAEGVRRALALFAPPDVAENRCCSAQLQQCGPAAGIDPSCGVAHGDRAAPSRGRGADHHRRPQRHGQHRSRYASTGRAGTGGGVGLRHWCWTVSACGRVGHGQRGEPLVAGLSLARCCVDAGTLVQLCCLKTHRFGGHFTLSLKNSVGLVAKHRPGDSHNYMGELHSSPHQRRMIAEINAAYRPALVVLDGVDAFVTGGPDRGELVHPGVVLAGTDRVALDAVGVALLRYFGTTPEVNRRSIFAQEQIARAVELGVGVDRPEKIELATDDAERRVCGEIRALLDA
ncbi:MAG: DUF362 domain-containing protein [Caldilineaceae bacterium]